MRWTVHINGGPRRVNHASVAVDKYIFSFGGYCTGDDYKSNRPIDVFYLSSKTYRWKALQKPDPGSAEAADWPFQRYGHTVVAHGRNIYLFGGRNDRFPCNRLYCFDTMTLKWSTPMVSGTVPSPRDGHSACIIGDAMYIFGGYAEISEVYSPSPAVFRLDLRLFEWTLLKCKGEPPIYRDFHTATAIDNKMFIFGGRSDNSNEFTPQTEFYSDKLIYLDLDTLHWEHPHIPRPKPIGRRSHSALNLNGGLLIFGGYNSRAETHMNDLWLLDIEEWRWQRLNPKGTGPEPRRRQSLCQVGDQIFLFGGTSPHEGPQIIFTQEQQSFMPETHSAHQKNLIDHNDTHVLDLRPSLRTLCINYVINNQHLYDLDLLPQGIKIDIDNMTRDNRLSEPLRFLTLPLG